MCIVDLFGNKTNNATSYRLCQLRASGCSCKMHCYIKRSNRCVSLYREDHNQLSIHGKLWEAILTFVTPMLRIFIASIGPQSMGKWFNDIPIVGLSIAGQQHLMAPSRNDTFVLLQWQNSDKIAES